MKTRKQAINFLLAGVGGQGTLFASNIVSEVGWSLGYDVKKAEIHGLSQRGGSVTSQVRWGEVVHSPIISRGEVDFLVAFEKLEAARYSTFLRPDGVLILNNYRIVPVTVSSGSAVYPPDADIMSIVRQFSQDIHWVDGLTVSQSVGNVRTMNVVILGALAKFVGGAESVWLEAIEKIGGKNNFELNQRAFLEGFNQTD